jgi:uncharacterized protein (TIGR00369 family)
MVATVLDGIPDPPCAVLLGWKILDAKPDQGWIRVAFEGKREFCNPAGFIQGGFLCAMLDDTMGPAAFIMGKGEAYTPTIDMHVSFLAPAKVGPIIGEGNVVQMGKTIVFLEGKLMDEKGTLLAKATASARMVATAKALR